MATRRSSSEWTKIIERYRAGGLTQREFCQREGVSISALHNWLYRPATAPGFVEVVRAPVEPGTGRVATIRVDGIELCVDVDDVARVVVEIIDGLQRRNTTP